MRYLIYTLLLFSLSGYGQSKMLLASIQQGSCPTGFFVDNAVTPGACEANSTAGWTATIEPEKVTVSVESTDVQDGSYAIKVTCNTDIVANVDMELALTGLTASTSYTITVYLKTASGAINIGPRLRNTDGWATSQSGTNINSGTYTISSVTGTTTGTTAAYTINFGTTFDAGEIGLIDNVVITQN